MRELHLPAHVSVCATEDTFVFLDLRADKYFSISQADGACLKGLVAGWPPSADEQTSAGSNRANASTVQRIADNLCQNGLLTDMGPASESDVESLPTPNETVLTALDSGFRPKLRLALIASVIATCIRAHYLMKTRTLEELAERTRVRRKRNEESGCEASTRAAIELAIAFHWIRPFLFTGQDRCLFDSFALVELLARHHMYPRWVFGVRTRPFGAHCWVQHGATILNCPVEQAKEFRPILSL